MQPIYSVGEIEHILHPVFASHGVRRAQLFGSCAKGFAFFGLLESATSTLNVPVDLINVTQIENGSQIENEINQTGVQIYRQ